MNTAGAAGSTVGLSMFLVRGRLRNCVGPAAKAQTPFFHIVRANSWNGLERNVHSLWKMGAS